MFAPEKLANYTRAKPERLDRFKKTIIPNAEPALYFLHLELPHVPFLFYASGSLYGTAKSRFALTDSSVNEVEWMARLTEYRFTQQAVYTDVLLGSLFAHVESQGIWDDMMVVVTADHGRSFKLNHDPRSTDRETVGEIAYVPLIVKLAGQIEGEIDASNLMAHDLLPTIASGLGLALPWAVEGYGANSEAIDQRGDDKHIFPSVSTGGFKTRLGEALTFSQLSDVPSGVHKRFGNAADGSAMFESLLRPLKALEFVGQSPEHFEFEAGSAAQLENLARLKQPGDKYPLGMVMGALAEPNSYDEVVVSINNRFVTASPVFAYGAAEGTFVAMLPDGVLQQQNTVELFGLLNGRLYLLKL